MTPEQLIALANRIDYEKLWQRPGMEHDSFTQEQKDRLAAGVNLRRYATQRGVVLEALKEGREYMRGFKLERCDFSTDHRGCGDNDWHHAINQFSEEQRKANKNEEWPGWMYTAKKVSDEVPRMILLFEHERKGLPTKYKMCAHDPSPATQLPDNHLRCHLGIECRKCPYLAAIEGVDRMTVEAKDEAKAWTCATHILLESKLETFFEGFLFDKGDAAFNDRLWESFAIEIEYNQSADE